MTCITNVTKCHSWCDRVSPGWNFPEHSVTFQNILGDSRTFQSILCLSDFILSYLILSWLTVFSQNNTEVIPMSDNTRDIVQCSNLDLVNHFVNSTHAVFGGHAL